MLDCSYDCDFPSCSSYDSPAMAATMVPPTTLISAMRNRIASASQRLDCIHIITFASVFRRYSCSLSLLTIIRV